MSRERGELFMFSTIGTFSHGLKQQYIIIRREKHNRGETGGVNKLKLLPSYRLRTPSSTHISNIVF